MLNPNPYQSPPAVSRPDAVISRERRLLPLCQYRAICPVCSAQVRRWYVFAFRKHPCRNCDATIKQQPKWEWIGSGFFGIQVAPLLLLGFLGLLPWGIAAGGVLLVLVAAWLTFPYISPYIVVRAFSTWENESTGDDEKLSNQPNRQSFVQEAR